MRTTLLTVAPASCLTLIEALPSVDHHKHSFDWTSTRHLLAFGDSYTFIQGTSGHPNYSFIGDAFNYAYDTETLLENEIVQIQTGTSAGGPNWVEYITGCGVYEGLTSPLSCERQLWDFAFAGAGVSESLIPLHHNYTISFENQIKQYTTYGHRILTSPSPSSNNYKPNPKNEPKPILDPSSTLTAIWIGINDINDSADYNLPSFPAFYEALISKLFSSLDPLTELGYRNYLILNLPPLDRTPANQKLLQAGQEVSPNGTQVGWFNTALAKHTSLFERQHPGVRALVFDAHSVLSDILDFPGDYGITNTTDFCPGYNQPDVEMNYREYGCPMPVSEYFWFNSGHITSTVHGILAGELRRVLEGWK